MNKNTHNDVDSGKILILMYYITFIGFLSTSFFIDESLFLYSIAGTVVTYLVGSCIVLLNLYKPELFGPVIFRSYFSTNENIVIAMSWPVFVTVAYVITIIYVINKKSFN